MQISQSGSIQERPFVYHIARRNASSVIRQLVGFCFRNAAKNHGGTPPKTDFLYTDPDGKDDVHMGLKINAQRCVLSRPDNLAGQGHDESLLREVLLQFVVNAYEFLNSQ